MVLLGPIAVINNGSQKYAINIDLLDNNNFASLTYCLDYRCNKIQVIYDKNFSWNLNYIDSGRIEIDEYGFHGIMDLYRKLPMVNELLNQKKNIDLIKFVQGIYRFYKFVCKGIHTVGINIINHSINPANDDNCPICLDPISKHTSESESSMESINNSANFIDNFCLNLHCCNKSVHIDCYFKHSFNYMDRRLKKHYCPMCNNNVKVSSNRTCSCS